jgi:hypothetical protein
MKLTWQPIDNTGATDGAPVVIADTVPTRGAGSKIVLSSSFSHQRASEAVQYPRAESAEFFDRGNQSTVFSALVLYEFSTLSACAQFIARLGNTLGGRGNLTLSYPGGGSDTIPRCVWQAIPVQPKIGIVVSVTYTFTGGQVYGGTLPTD